MKNGYPNEKIRQYFHCATCLPTIPRGESPESWARLSVGTTLWGFQVWCVRCNKNVVHIDLLGQSVATVNMAHPEEKDGAGPLRPEQLHQLLAAGNQRMGDGMKKHYGIDVEADSEKLAELMKDHFLKKSTTDEDPPASPDSIN